MGLAKYVIHLTCDLLLLVFIISFPFLSFLAKLVMFIEYSSGNHLLANAALVESGRNPALLANGEISLPDWLEAAISSLNLLLFFKV